METIPGPEINISSYEWSVRFFSILKRLLSVNIKMHHQEGQIESGEIFLFNHFARFETFIPQYLIYEKNGDYCRSIASSEFFTGDDTFANYLLSVGAVPNNHPNLIPFMAREILRGRKVIIFPEGGMVKDRRSLDSRGQYSIYSRTARERRKHHTGAAVLSLGVDILKQSILHAFEQRETDRIQSWQERLQLQDENELYEVVSRPSTIVPSNITFYPMRVGDNMLHRGVELFNRGLSKRLSEELLIEGNILLKNTDMDIRLGDTLSTESYWSWWTRPVIKRLTRHTETLVDLLDENPAEHSIEHSFLLSRIRKNALRLRNDYMRAVYEAVTINLSHLAATIIYELLEAQHKNIEHNLFHRTLYLAIKQAQELSGIHLHRSLRNPEFYQHLLLGKCKGLDQFFTTTSQLGLIELEDNQYHFLPKLCLEHEFDSVRLENMVEVYANEVEPIHGIREAIPGAIEQARDIDEKTLALFQFDDELKAYQWDKEFYSKPRFEEINAQETATRSGEPFFLVPNQSNQLGILLSHGFLASPAEVETFGERLQQAGFPVIAPRLKGHGTSPWDLRDRIWQDWLASIDRAYNMLKPFCKRICMIGFSTGGALSLIHASKQPDGLMATIALSVPLKFVNRNMIFVPLVHHANRLMRWLPSYEGIVPFRPNHSEHPDINYYSMPVHGLFQLRLMASELDKRLKDIHTPVHLYQADKDPVVAPSGADIIMKKIGSEDKKLTIVPAQRHGILNENLGNVQQLIIDELLQMETTLQQDSDVMNETLLHSGGTL